MTPPILTTQTCTEHTLEVNLSLNLTKLGTTTQTFSRLANAARPAQPSLLSPSPPMMTTDHRPGVMTRDNDNDSDNDYNDDLMINDPPLQIL